MASAAELVLLLKGNADDLSAGMGKAKGMVGGLVDSLGKIGLAGMGIGVVTDVVGSVAGSFGDLIGKAEGLGDAGARVGLVWGAEMQGVIEDNATVANSLGLTKTAYLDQVGALGQLATSLGVTGDAGADMAMGLTELAPKLAAYAGVEGEVASDALEKALLGKTKGLAALGIAITDADKAQAALALGIGGEPAKWNEAQIAQVNYAAVLAKTGAAQAAWADNQGDVEVSMQRVSAAMDDAKAAIGEKLLPIIAPLAEKFASVLPGAIDATMSVVGPLFDRLGSIDLSAVMGSISSLADALSAIGSGNSSEALDFLANAFNELTGIDVSSWIEPVRSGLADLQDKAQAVLDVISPWVAKFDEVVGISNTVGVIIGVALVAAFGALAVAAGSAAIGVVTSLAPILIPIAAIGLAVAVLKAAWDNNWGGIQDKVASVVGWFTSSVWPVIQAGAAALMAAFDQLAAVVIDVWSGQIMPAVQQFISWFASNVLPVLQAVGSGIMSVMSSIVGFVVDNWSTIASVISSNFQVIVGVVQVAMSLIGGIISTVLALIRGDWAGAWESLKTAAAGALAGVQKIIGGLVSYVSGLASLVLAAAKRIGSAIGEGIQSTLESGWQSVLGKLRSLVALLPETVKKLLGIASPSKVFEELGIMISLGLASGIQKSDQKAVAALADVVSKMASMAGGLADFGKKIAEAIMPSDAQIAMAKEKYVRLTLVITDFVKFFSYLGALLPVSSSNQATGGQMATINAGIIKLSQMLPNIAELRGLTSDMLLTGGEASWASQLADIVGKVAGVWGSIADNLTKIADAKFPDDSRLAALKDATVRIALWITDIMNQPAIPAGAQGFADGIKAATDALSSVAKTDLSGVVRLAQGQVDDARLNAADLWVSFAGLSAVFRGLAVEVQTEIVAGFQRFSTGLKAASDGLRAGIVNSEDLKGLTRLGADVLDIVKANVLDMWMAEATLSGYFRSLAVETQTGIVDGMKRFADGAKAASDLMVGVAGVTVDWSKVSAIPLEALDIVQQNIVDILARVQPMAESAGQIPDALRPYVDGAKAALDLMVQAGGISVDWSKASEVPLAALDLIQQNIVDILARVQPMAESAGELPAALKPYVEGAKSALDLMSQAGGLTLDWSKVTELSLSVLDILQANIENALARVQGMALAAGDLPAGLKAYVEGAKASLDLMAQAGGLTLDWSKATAVSLSVLDLLQANVENVLARVQSMVPPLEDLPVGLKAYVDAAKSALDLFAAAGGITLDWSKATEISLSALDLISGNIQRMITALDGMIPAGFESNAAARAKDFAGLAQVAVGLFTDTAKGLADIASVSVGGDLTGRFAQIEAAIRLSFDALGRIIADIPVDVAQARAALATASGQASKGLAEVADGIQHIMALATGGLFGADPTRGDLGFTQRTRGTRANFNASVLTDTIKRIVSALVASLKDLALPDAGDPKIKAITALGDAFGKLGDGVDKLSKAKLPDAKRLRELASVVAASMGGGGFGAPAFAGGGAGGGAGGAGPMTLNLANPVLNFPPITASVVVNTTPTIVIGHATIETLATIIEQKIADRFIIGAGGGSPITTGGPPTSGKLPGRP